MNEGREQYCMMSRRRRAASEKIGRGREGRQKQVEDVIYLAPALSLSHNYICWQRIMRFDTKAKEAEGRKEGREEVFKTADATATASISREHATASRTTE